MNLNLSTAGLDFMCSRVKCLEVWTAEKALLFDFNLSEGLVYISQIFYKECVRFLGFLNDVEHSPLCPVPSLCCVCLMVVSSGRL